MKVDSSYALLVFFYNADIALEQRYPIIEGDLLKEVNFQAEDDFPQFASGHIPAQRGRIAILMGAQRSLTSSQSASLSLR